MRLGGKVAIITGSAHGIGRASAELFAREGAKVLVADVDEAAGRMVADSICSKGGVAAFLRTDVTRTSDARRMVTETVRRWKRLDVMFSNAGIELDKPFERVSEAEWDGLIDSNLKGMFLSCKYAYEQMLRQDAGGSIITMSSAQGLVSMPGQSAYSASKSGVIGLTRGMAIDGGPHRIRANCICPGFVSTRMTGGISAKRKRLTARLHPLSRVGKPQDVAYAALFLASDESSFVTGCVLTVDGGLTAASPEMALSRLNLRGQKSLLARVE